MTLTEMMMAVGIMSFLLVIIYAFMGNARTAYFDASTSLQLRNTLRNAVAKMEMELRNTGIDSAGNAQFTIIPGLLSDSIRFSVPVVCSSSAAILDASGNPAHWGAGLFWGCNDFSCMDEDNDCTTIEYKFIQYRLQLGGRLIRDTLNQAFQSVQSQVLVRGLSSVRFSYDQPKKTVRIQATAIGMSSTRRVLTESISQNIRLMN